MNTMPRTKTNALQTQATGYDGKHATTSYLAKGLFVSDGIFI